MANYIRKIVSGDRARFKDAKLDLELDLAYLTDRILIMGFPATGIQSLYRNRRGDTRKFLEHRHRKNYRVFNFCPIRENSYEADVFEGRVSRFPFPDHHAPPLSMIPLVVREIREWLNASPERVAVLHCRAGKGRSGTMACAYLLAADDFPQPPQLLFGENVQQWADKRAEETMDIISLNPDTPTSPRGLNAPSELHSSSPASPISPGPGPFSPLPAKDLQGVIDFHTSRRIRAPSPGKKAKPGVGIASQRRFLHYWSLLLANNGGPPYVLDPPVPVSQVRLTGITIRMRETSPAAVGLVRAASMVIRRMKENAVQSNKLIWAALARYDDECVETLRTWERSTRDEMHLGRKRPAPGDRETNLFVDGSWDKGKMVTSFATMGPTRQAKSFVTDDDENKIITYALQPSSGEGLNKLRDEFAHSRTKTGTANGDIDPSEQDTAKAEVNAISNITSPKDEGIVVRSDREVRIKLFMGQVFLGWFWIIPAFHMDSSESATRLTLQRNELDFILGVGNNIVDVEVEIERV